MAKEHIPPFLVPVFEALAEASELQRITCNNTGTPGALHWQKVADEVRRVLPPEKTDEKKPTT